MSIKKKIRKTCLLILGCNPEPEQWNTWDQVVQLSEVFGERKLQEVFDEWAETRKGDIFKNGPVTEFLKIAPGLCTGVIQLKPKGDLFALLNDLAGISDNRVIFNHEQQAAIGRLLSGHSPADVKSAFKEFWENVENDDFAVRQAAKTFVEGVEQILAVQARRQEKAQKTQELLVRKMNEEREKLAREQAECQKIEELEERLIEDSLGG